MQAFELSNLIQQRATQGDAYLEFLSVPDLSMGIYCLPKDGTDPQQPHAEAEVYFVVSGKCHFICGSEEQAISAGSVLYVPKNVPHRFLQIEEDLTLLVFFAPAEGTSAVKREL